MAHLPSGDFNPNAAWLALAALGHNLTRALATLAGHGLHHATTATIRRALVAVPARLVRPVYEIETDGALGTKRHLRLPEHSWQTALIWCRRRIDAIPVLTRAPTPLTAHDLRNLGQAGSPVGQERPDPAGRPPQPRSETRRPI